MHKWLALLLLLLTPVLATHQTTLSIVPLSGEVNNSTNFTLQINALSNSPPFDSVTRINISFITNGWSLPSTIYAPGWTATTTDNYLILTGGSLAQGSNLIMNFVTTAQNAQNGTFRVNTTDTTGASFVQSTANIVVNGTVTSNVTPESTQPTIGLKSYLANITLKPTNSTVILSNLTVNLYNTSGPFNSSDVLNVTVEEGGVILNYSTNGTINEKMAINKQFSAPLTLQIAFLTHVNASPSTIAFNFTPSLDLILKDTNAGWQIFDKNTTKTIVTTTLKRQIFGTLTANATQVMSNSNTTIRLTINNTGTAAVKAINVSMSNYSATVYNAVLISSNGRVWSCIGPANCTASNPVDALVTNETLTLDIVANVSGKGTLLWRALLLNTSDVLGEALLSLPVKSPANMSLQVIQPASVTKGFASSITINVTNGGDTNLAGLTTTATGKDSANVTVTPSITGPTAIAANSTGQFTLQFTVPANATGPLTINFTVNGTDAVFGSNLTASTSAALTVKAPAKLDLLSASASATALYPGSSFNVTAVLRNAGENNLTTLGGSLSTSGFSYTQTTNTSVLEPGKDVLIIFSTVVAPTIVPVAYNLSFTITGTDNMTAAAIANTTNISVTVSAPYVITFNPLTLSAFRGEGVTLTASVKNNVGTTQLTSLAFSGACCNYSAVSAANITSGATTDFVVTVTPLTTAALTNHTITVTASSANFSVANSLKLEAKAPVTCGGTDQSCCSGTCNSGLSCCGSKCYISTGGKCCADVWKVSAGCCVDSDCSAGTCQNNACAAAQTTAVTKETAQSAISAGDTAITDASLAIDDARTKGYAVADAATLLRQAKDKLEEARSALQAGDNQKAQELALEAKQLAEDAKAEIPLTAARTAFPFGTVIAFVVGILIVGSIGGFILLKQKKKPQKSYFVAKSPYTYQLPPRPMPQRPVQYIPQRPYYPQPQFSVGAQEPHYMTGPQSKRPI